MRTKQSHENIVALSDIRQDKLRALSPYGPVKAGLTTLPRTSEVRLTELLNSLEKIVQDLNYKSFTVLSTLVTATKTIVAERYDIVTGEDGINAVQEP